MTSRWSSVTAAGETARSAVLGTTEQEQYLVLLGHASPRRQSSQPEQRLAAILAAFKQAPGAACWGRQVHGATIVTVLGSGDDRRRSSAVVVPGSVSCVGACDGLMTDLVDVGLVVWTADCVPVLLAGGGAAAAIHSGWRGTAAGIVADAVDLMRSTHSVEPSQIRAVIGPAVGGCHYQVGDEVVEALADRGIPEAVWLERRPGGECRVDLRALLRAELEAAGIPPDGIELVGGCTFCDPTLASYRRDGAAAGRQWSMIVRRGSGAGEA